MVLKKSKFGGNTGNTLRRSGKGGYKTCRTAAFISKECNSMQQHDDLGNDWPMEDWMKNGIPNKKNTNSLNTSDYIRFSLNKDKRWLLPDKLKHEVEMEPYFRKCKKDAQRERCKQTRTGRSRVAVIQRVSDYGKYLGHRDMKSFTNSVDGNHNRTSKSWMGPLDIPVGILESMDITYTIESSIDSATWPYHNDHTDPFYRFLSKYSKDKFPGNLNTWDHLDTNENDDLFSDGDDDAEFVDIDGQCSMFDAVTTFRQETISLEMFIKPKQKKTKRKKKRKSSCFRDSVQKINYKVINEADEILEFTNVGGIHMETFGIENGMEGEDGNEEVEGEDATTPAHFNNQLKDDNKTYKEFECKMKTEDFSPKYLVKQFGEQYVEGRCTPRRFIIFNEYFNPEGIVLCVRILTSGSRYSTVNIAILNISKDSIPCLEEVFEDDINLEFLVDLFLSREVDEIEKISKPKANSPKTAIGKGIRPSTDLIRINDVCHELFSHSHHGEDSDRFYANCYQSVCPICYMIAKVTCLKDCPHYACNECWRLYINSKVASGFHNTIFCPDTYCEQTIDVVTIISFLDYKMISGFIRKYCEFHVLKSPSVQFCPSAHCDVVAVCGGLELRQCENRLPMVTLTGDYGIMNSPCVDCRCNLSWCFNCQEADHWPSSCFVNKIYLLKKKKNFGFLFDKNGNLFETEVPYRPCPKCKNPINKNGGCTHMFCTVCRYQFCWECLGPYIGHGSECTRKNKDLVLKFTSMDMFSRGVKQARMFGEAITYSFLQTKARILERKLGLRKMNLKYANVVLQSNVLVSTATNALMLLVSGYKLLENLSAVNATCPRKYTRTRVKRLANFFSLVLGLLYSSVDVNRLDKINVVDVRKYIGFVESFLNDLSSIGLDKRKSNT